MSNLERDQSESLRKRSLRVGKHKKRTKQESASGRNAIKIVGAIIKNKQKRARRSSSGLD